MCILKNMVNSLKPIWTDHDPSQISGSTGLTASGTCQAISWNRFQPDEIIRLVTYGKDVHTENALPFHAANDLKAQRNFQSHMLHCSILTNLSSRTEPCPVEHPLPLWSSTEAQLGTASAARVGKETRKDRIIDRSSCNGKHPCTWEPIRQVVIWKAPRHRALAWRC